MKLNIFIIFLLFLQFVRVLLLPVVLLAYPFSAWIRRRLSFEFRNIEGESDRFKKVGQKALVAFEVSSEGELEQIRPILEKYLAAKKRVELIFSSSSVEKKCLEIYREYKELVRIKRLPILFFNPTKEIRGWMSASTIIFCRYDFYPELVLYSRGVRAVVLSATLKGNLESIQKSRIKKWYYSNLYKTFGFIVTSSEFEIERFISLGIDKERLDSYDFRVDRIKERIDSAEKKISVFPFWPSFHKLMEEFKIEKRVIIGNCWPVEISSLTKQMIGEIKRGELLLFIAPHKLNDNFVNEIKDLLIKKIGEASLTIINKLGELEGTISGEKQVYLILTPGILCELYTFFGHSLIGGGFGRSIHSVFEPFLAGSYCYMGPKTFRSTEYDFSLKYGEERVKIIKRSEDFYSTLINGYTPLELDWDILRTSKNRVEGRILGGEL